ncbi:MAG: tol-pal system YbgF family protein [Polyangiales bacterium]
MKPSMEERVRESLRDETPEHRVNRMWAGIEGRRAPKKAPTRWLALAAVAAALAAGFFLWPTEETTLALEDGSSVPAQLNSDSVHIFSDGSRIDAGAGANLDTLSNIEGEVAFALRSGAAHFDIVPRGPRRWRVVASGVEVVVVGTVFDVERTPEAVAVRVERGVVLVRGANVPDGEQRLEAGDVLQVILNAAADTEQPEAEVGSDPQRAPDSLDAVAPDSLDTVVPDLPAAEASRSETSLEDLLGYADAARREGRHAQAVRWLARASSEHPEAPRAALAAFTQGRIELESLDRPAPAARSFARSLRIGLPRPLRETAQALRVVSLGQAGDPAAPAASARFLARYPQSQYRQEVIDATGAGESTP